MSPSSERHDPGSVLSPRRAMIALALGAAAGAVVALAGEPALLPVVAWIVAVLVVLTWVWRIIWPQDHLGTERLAEAEGHSRTTDTAVLVAAVISLAAVVLALVRSTSADDAGATASVILSV